MSLPPILTDTESIARLAEELLREPVIAVDMEADSLHSYREKVCLLQISTPSRTALIDPLGNADLSSLQPVMADGSVRKIFHAADYDIRCLHRDFFWEIRGLFDTMVACQFLGEEKVGLADALKKYLGVDLDKQHQRADWSLRPLSESMIRYAAEDTRHLHELAGLLEQKLAEKDRLFWVKEEFGLLEKVRHSESQGPLFLRAKGAATLERRQLAVLEALLQWREEEACHRDRPPFRVVGHQALLEVARTGPRTLQGLLGIDGLSPRMVDRYGRQWLKTIETASAIAEEKLPLYPRTARRVKSPEADRRLSALKKWRRSRAEQLELSPGVLINNAVLEELSHRRPRTSASLETIPGMKDWQRQVLGKEILEQLR